MADMHCTNNVVDVKVANVVVHLAQQQIALSRQRGEVTAGSQQLSVESLDVSNNMPTESDV